LVGHGHIFAPHHDDHYTLLLARAREDYINQTQHVNKLTARHGKLALSATLQLLLPVLNIQAVSSPSLKYTGVFSTTPINLDMTEALLLNTKMHAHLGTESIVLAHLVQTPFRAFTNLFLPKQVSKATSLVANRNSLYDLKKETLRGKTAVTLFLPQTQHLRPAASVVRIGNRLTLVYKQLTNSQTLGLANNLAERVSFLL